jgi:hypothetical protein
MALRAPELYQGGDWLTYRATVAKAFDTLDHLEDICHPRATFSAPVSTAELTTLFGEAAELCDDLSGDLDAVLADLFPHGRADAIHRWMGFEMQLHLNAMRAEVRKEYNTAAPSLSVLDEIAALAARIRALLRRIDQ